MSRSHSSSTTLGSTPLLHLVTSMAERQTSGSVVFETPSGPTGVVHLELGVPRKVLATAPHTRLSELLADLGWIDEHTARETYAAAKAQQLLHGQLLIEYRLIDLVGLDHVLSHQMVRKLDWIATQAPETRVSVFEGQDLLPRLPPSSKESSPLGILWALARSHVDETNKRFVLERAAHRQLQLHRLSEPGLFGFNELELSFVERLRHGQLDLHSLLYSVDLPRPLAEALLYLLLLTHHIDSSDGRLPLGVAHRFSHMAPRGSGEYATPVRFGVDRQPAQSRDPLPAVSDRGGTIRPRTQESDPPGDRKVHRALRDDALRRAEQLLKRERLAEAELEARRALQLDPAYARCIAIHAWIRALMPNSQEDLERILQSLSHALDLDPMYIEARYYRSEVLKRLNRMDEAVGEWRLILELDPKHLNAQRELRLWEMRRSSGRPPQSSTSGLHRQVTLSPPAPSLLDKWFKGRR